MLRGGGAASAAKIQDEAARAFALWYRYRNSPIGGTAEAIEQFRLSHPDWPGQDDLREKAETVLFLTDASPEAVKAFFSPSGPLTGAGKAALAGVYLKDGNEQGARDLVVSAWRDHQLNAAVEAKILSRFGYMLTAEQSTARASTGCSIPTTSRRRRRRCASSKLLPARRAEEGRSAHRRGAAWRQRRQAARRASRQRGRGRRRA